MDLYVCSSIMIFRENQCNLNTLVPSFTFILDKYKGKAVLIDVWATWCGPCRGGHQAMKPLKEEMKCQNVQFVYITSPSSPLQTWQNMIGDIDGDHYYLTQEQYKYILDKYESDGIPTYAIYNTKGEQTFKCWFSGNWQDQDGTQRSYEVEAYN